MDLLKGETDSQHSAFERGVREEVSYRCWEKRLGVDIWEGGVSPGLAVRPALPPLRPTLPPHPGPSVT